MTLLDEAFAISSSQDHHAQQVVSDLMRRLSESLCRELKLRKILSCLISRDPKAFDPEFIRQLQDEGWRALHG